MLRSGLSPGLVSKVTPHQNSLGTITLEMWLVPEWLEATLGWGGGTKEDAAEKACSHPRRYSR